MKTLTMLMQEGNTNFNGRGFQPINLNTEITINNKNYTFWIPFSYYLDVNKKRRIQFTIKQSALLLFPHISLLEDEKWVTTWYNLILELTKKYNHIWVIMINTILRSTNQLILDWYLVEKKVKELGVPSLGEVYWVETSFDDLLTWKVRLGSQNRHIVDVKIISRVQVDVARKALGLSNIATQTLGELKWIVRRLGLAEGVRELSSNQARTYYLRLITDYTSRKNSVGRDLLPVEKQEVIKNVNDFIDAVANLVTRG